jgi:DNA repair photolyase
MGVEPYKTHGFKPAFADWRLRQRLPKRDFIFVSDMGDMWGDWVPREWIERVLKVLRTKPRSVIFFLTKNPKRYHEFLDMFTENMLLGVTIETNRPYKITKAPPPRERYEAMRDLDWGHKAVVIEPILDFDAEFIDWIREIRPERIHIGYDNYGNRLPEPPLEKTVALKKELSRVTQVEISSLRKAWYE